MCRARAGRHLGKTPRGTIALIGAPKVVRIERADTKIGNDFMIRHHETKQGSCGARTFQFVWLGDSANAGLLKYAN